MKFKALLKFNKIDKGRTKPISIDYYIPQIKIGDNSYVSSSIKAKDKKFINPGEELQVEIYAPNINKVVKGQILTFWEPPIQVGEIMVIEIVDNIKDTL